MSICFILDGILILYGIILTVLYCRLRVRQTVPQSSNQQPAEQPEKKPTEGLYAGLYAPTNDTYETIRMDKKYIV
uniref:Fc receptor, IgE, high affinity I, gamma polypeptide like n=1 Tax=Solea senegalensis TaxID=28829 RepID=UPI001CD8C966|nr:Fc receptor, IgE, high affinity I, gamma polypeptide like [Solea senegalensis]